MGKTIEIEVWIVVDENGDHAVGLDAEIATERYTEDVGELSATCGFRTVKVKLTVPLPVVVELTGVVPEVDEPGKLVVA